MNFNEVVKSYFHGLESGSYDQIISLFHADAVIYSPLYGEKKATEFYKELFAVTYDSKISLKNIFVSTENDYSAAAHFLYVWTLQNGVQAPFECVDIFEFALDGKIIALKIIYDTYFVRPEFNVATALGA